LPLINVRLILEIAQTLFYIFFMFLSTFKAVTGAHLFSNTFVCIPPLERM